MSASPLSTPRLPGPALANPGRDINWAGLLGLLAASWTGLAGIGWLLLHG